ncbi:substrate-binding domain-containing protein [Mediterraneibacter glycyrrhizinilyticus]|uniref:substrate-binding domain-containing protein n=1 Tax=Mediterraneibacter glycyrrhizinilyticus TaxID=342942 RepID=UPI0019612187|nr:substrate-binding domain-containing protein [Mediterraneibacter glycyrrhizinilyticus]MBM6751493.1 substrate-binding domain-containing protein [Mediterraneibacter glycyrrhizinilyticus]
MKNWKRLAAMGMSAAMLLSLAGCSTTTSTGDAGDAAAGGDAAATTGSGGGGDLEGAHVFMFKSTGNSFGDLMYEGFSEYLEGKGEKTSYQSPAETTVAAQVQMLDELITQKVASITISTNGDAGYDEVFKRAQDAGIPIVSVDSEANPEYRICHVNQAEVQAIGSYLVQAGVLITLGIDYPGDGKMEETLAAELPNYSGDEIKLGVLSASIDTPVQNSWIDAMRVELEKDMYAGKVSPELDIKYGNDDLTESTTQAQAFIAENSVDCIISPTTVGIAAAGQALKSANSEIELTGLGIPSEMQSFMPNTADENAFDYVCPYMMLWDVIHLGAVAGAAQYAAMNDGFDGSVGSSFEMDAFRDYEATTYEAYESGDGTAVLAGEPFIFSKDNMEEWIDVL